MKNQIHLPKTSTHVLILVCASLLGVAVSAALAEKSRKSSPAKVPASGNVPAEVTHTETSPAKAKKTADWYKNEECRMVFFTVLEGLYRDGISEEVVDLVIGRVEANDLERAFIFRCKLCHACYEAFAAYQRRPDFQGTEGVRTIGNREISKEVIQVLRNGGRRQFDMAFASIVQPWIRGKLHALIDSGSDETEMMEKFVALAKQGNDLITGYSRCQACDAISAVAEKVAEK